jgi:transposase InsO family protein
MTNAAMLDAQTLVRELKGLVGAEPLRCSVPGISRRMAALVKRETVAAMERERRHAAQHVSVAAPGIIRGFDQMYVDTLDGLRYLLIAADGCVPYRTSIAVTERYDGKAVATALAHDIAQHGAPLVWRQDRASATRSQKCRNCCVRTTCSACTDRPSSALLRPPRTPEPRASGTAPVTRRGACGGARSQRRAHANDIERPVAQA